MIALISQATQERAGISPHKKLPTLVYIDEAQDYFATGMETLISQGRKYHVGLVLAHQNLAQFPRDLRASVMASTAIKYAGGVSADDALTVSREMRCDADFLKGMVKGGGQSRFALFVRNITPEAQECTIPFGTLEALPRLSQAEFRTLLEDNRDRYCAPIDPTSGSVKGYKQSKFNLGAHQAV